MTTLAAAVAVGDQQLIIDAPMAGPFPGWVKIDDEVLKVGGAQYREGTTLPLSESATAAHDSGATVTYASRPYSATFNEAIGGAGGVQTVRLLGPFRVNWNSPGITTNPGFPLTDIFAGQIVIVAWAELIVWWNRTQGNTELEILVGGANWETGAWPVVAVNVHELDPSGIADANLAPSATPEDPPSGFTKPMRAITDGKLLAKVNFSGDSTTGAADIYALIAEPSA